MAIAPGRNPKGWPLDIRLDKGVGILGARGIAI
jgi:hypothetical protein